MRSDFYKLQESIQIGDHTTCQLGDPTDSSEYLEDVPVIIAGIRKVFDQKFFLAKVIGESCFMTAYVHPFQETKGTLCSFVVERYGVNCRLQTEVQAKRELGF